MPVRKITDEQFAAARKIREETGLPISRIIKALDLPISIPGLTYRMSIVGVEPKKPWRKRRTKVAQNSEYVRVGRPVRPFSPEEDAQLLTLAGRKLRIADIARQMQRAPNTVAYRFARLQQAAEAAKANSSP